jgi:drug/metabolite transporter (DMT)-like permease
VARLVGDVGPYGLALLSALVHAGWNVALARGRGSGPGLARSAAATTTGVLLLTPFALATWRVDAAAYGWAAASACAEIAYFVLLGRAYRGAPVSRTYPVARGLAPVLVLAATVVVTRSVLPLEVLAVALVVAGVLLVAGDGGRPDARVVGLAAPVSAGIATYTVLDSYGVQHASPAAYLWVAMTPVALGLCVLSALDRTSAGRLQTELCTPMSWVTGAGIMAAYGLVLVALSVARPDQVPVVAGLRETSVVLVPVLAAVVARRRPSPWVLGGGGLIAAAVVLLDVL